MISRWIRAAGVFALAPAAAFAFETVDRLPFPSLGTFPAYPGDPVRPLELYAYGGFMYDSNAFRDPGDGLSDVVARLGAGARYTGRIIGRQRIVLEGFGEYYDYDRFSEVDHFGYGLQGELHWELGNDINGAAVYSRRHRHADLGEFRRERRDMITSDRFLFDGGYRLGPSLRLFGAYEHVASDRDFEDEDDLTTNSVRASITYSTPLANAIGLEARALRGDARVPGEVAGTAVNNDFEERELAVTLTYVLSAQVRTSGRVGHTEREYKDLESRNFSGTTYAGLVEWLPTTKLTLSLEAFRRPESIVDVSSTHVIRQGATAGVAWAPTFKLVFTARFTNEHRLSEGDPATVVLGTPVRDETLRFWRFAAGWEPRRHWQLGAGFDIGERTSNEVGRDYDYTQVMLNLRWVY